MSILSFIIVCLLYLYGFFLIYISFLARKKGEKEAFINNLTITLVFLTALTINLIIANYINLVKGEFMVFPFDYLMISIIILFIPIFYILISREKKRLKTEPAREIIHSGPKILPFKYDIYRKLTHLVVLAIIFFYFTLGFLIQIIFINILDFLSENFQISREAYAIFTIEGEIMIFTHYLVVFLVGISLIGLFTADIIRILKPEIYPLKPVNRILRDKELHMRLGPHISMSVGCFSIILLFGLIQPIGPLVICTSMTIAIFGDMSANLIGRTLGKRKIRNTNKTYEGLLAGIIAGFISGLILLISLSMFFVISLSRLILFPLIGAAIIGLLDYLDLEIDDNLLFTFTIASVLFFLSIVIL